MSQTISRIVSVFLILLVIFVFQDRPVMAQEAITIMENRVSYDFGSHLEISAKVNTDQSLKDVFIILQSSNETSRQIKLVSGSDGLLKLKYDLNRYPLKPFARVYYWYTFETTDGTVLTSPSFWFDYIDDRYEWRQLTSKLFTIYWTGEDITLGQKILDIATAGLENSTTILPIAPTLPINIYVYPDVTSLQDALTISHQVWVAGHASPEIGVVLVSNGADQVSQINFERQIPHELMHILQYQVTGKAYGNAPAWLLEGMATLAQTYPNPDDDRVLTEAVKSNDLIPLDKICQSLPIDSKEATIAYAQSKELVKYLQDQFGSQIFLKMLQSSLNGLACEQVLKSNTDLTPTQLLTAWQDSKFPDSNIAVSNRQSWLLYVFGAIGLGILAFIIFREILIRKKTRNE